MLEIDNLKVSTGGKLILNGISLSFNDSKVYAIMGPNGSGKTTLAFTIMGHPDYKIEEGKIVLNGEDITGLQPHERAKKGIFLGFQNPVEIQGLPILSFLKAAYSSIKNPNVSTYVFNRLLKNKLEEVGFGNELLNRNVNEGLSGGERKKLEVIQMYVLEPTHVILDEIDSGLDVDSLESVAKAIKNYHSKYNSSLVLVTHYARILKYITPDRVIVISGGRAVAEGGPELADKIDKEGYGWLQKVEGS